MKYNYVIEALNAMQYMAIALQDNPILQGVQLGLSILTSIVLVAYRIWKWHNEATKDGKITKDEIEEGAKIISDGLEEVNDKVNGKDKRDNG
jgi:hypothetical protein